MRPNPTRDSYPTPAAEAVNFIQDGHFEEGQAATSPWTLTGNTPCTWICFFETAWNLAPYDGLYDLWVGGMCNLGMRTRNVNQVSQTVTVPDENPRISFYYASWRVHPNDPAGDDIAYVQIDGNDVWTLDVSTRAANTWNGGTGGFVFVEVDVGAFAGQTVALTVGYRTSDLGPGVGNVRFDAFEGTNPVPVTLQRFVVE